MASEATAKRITEKAEPASGVQEAEAPLFAPHRDLNKRGLLLIGGLILLANIPLIHYFFRHVLTPMPVAAGVSLPFTDDFNRADVGERYWSTGGDWRIESGELHSASVRNNPLWLKASLPNDVAVDFDVRPASPEGDVRFVLFGDGLNQNSGYTFLFGSYGMTAIQRIADDPHQHVLTFDGRGVGLPGPANEPEQSAIAGRGMAELYKNGTLGPSTEWRMERRDLRAQPGTSYHMHVERRGGDIKWYANNQLVFEVNDPSPLTGKGHDRFAPSGMDTDAFFDNLAIQKL